MTINERIQVEEDSIQYMGRQMDRAAAEKAMEDIISYQRDILSILRSARSLWFTYLALLMRNDSLISPSEAYQAGKQAALRGEKDLDIGYQQFCSCCYQKPEIQFHLDEIQKYYRIITLSLQPTGDIDLLEGFLFNYKRVYRGIKEHLKNFFNKRFYSRNMLNKSCIIIKNPASKATYINNRKDHAAFVSRRTRLSACSRTKAQHPCLCILIRHSPGRARHISIPYACQQRVRPQKAAPRRAGGLLKLLL